MAVVVAIFAIYACIDSKKDTTGRAEILFNNDVIWKYSLVINYKSSNWSTYVI